MKDICSHFRWRKFLGLLDEPGCQLTDGDNLEYLKIFPYGLLFSAFVGMFLNLLWISLDQKYAPTLSYILDGFEEGMASVFRALIQINRRNNRGNRRAQQPDDNGYVWGYSNLIRMVEIKIHSLRFSSELSKFDNISTMCLAKLTQNT